jgi:RNA polymerase sigma-70 factor (ECF subfamily)
LALTDSHDLAREPPLDHDSPDASGSSLLVERIRRGDRAAESDLVARYTRGVRMVVSRNSSDRTVVDDLCQETFSVALKKIRQGDVRDPSRLPGFMCGLARNITIDHYRRASRAPVAAVIEESDPAPNQLDLLLMREQAAVARAVLAELSSERDRQILFRFYVAEDSKAQICADLGLSALHFNRVLFRARERYRALYESTVAGSSGNR